MNQFFKRCAFIFLGARVLVDSAASITLYYQSGALVVGLGALLVCSIFSVFLYFGIRNEEFCGRRGCIYLSGEQSAYWFVVAFLVISHTIVTGLMVNLIRW